MECADCGTTNAPEASFCRSCGVGLAENSESASPGLPPIVPADNRLSELFPNLIAEEPAPEYPDTTQLPAAAPEPASLPPRRSPVPIVIIGAAAVIVLGVVLLLVTRSDSGTTQITPSTAAGSTAVESVAPTAVATTAAATRTVPPAPWAIPPIPTGQAPTAAPGSPQVLANQQPSGPFYAEVEPSFILAQELADALALADWETVRRIDTVNASRSDQGFEDGYRDLERASLMLIDARPNGDGYELLVVSVAVENGGAQTSLYCLAWTADPTLATVSQNSGERLTTISSNVQPEAIRNDPVALADVDRCAWPA